jgi:hypothetical protein
LLLKVILAVFVLVVAAFILVIVLTVEEADKAEITRADYQQVKIGMTPSPRARVATTTSISAAMRPYIGCATRTESWFRK